MPVPGDTIAGPDRCRQGTMDDAVEARTQRVRNHLQRPDHSDWQLTNARIRSTVYRTVPTGVSRPPNSSPEPGFEAIDDYLGLLHHHEMPSILDEFHGVVRIIVRNLMNER